MNIGSLIRGLLGDSKAGEPKSVELKEGQVVRGVVLSVSDSGKEAMVQIQGTPVRAELETPLTPGQTLNLQVGTPGENGLPVLKPVSLGEAALASPQSMGEAIESLGLTNSKAGREIVQAMQSGGLALTKETAAKLDAVMNAKPPGVPASEWLEAAVISVKRGLPVTAETVKGLQQAVFGPKLHQLLATLESELNVWAQQGDAGKSAESAGGNKPAAGVLTGGTTAPLTGNTVTAGVLPGANTDADLPASKAGATGNNAPSGAAGSVETQSGSGMVSNTGSNNGNVNAGNTQAIGSAGQAAAALNADSAAEGEVPGGLAQKLPLSEAASANKAVSAGDAEPAGAAPAGAGAAKGSGSTDPAGSRAAAAGQNEAAAAREGSGAAAAGRTEAAGAREGAGAAAPVNSALQPQSTASGTALLAKLQGVLTELRGTLPQLATAPPASGAAGEGPAAAQPPQGNAAPPAPAGQGQVPAAPRGDASAAAAQPQQGTAPAPDTESWVGRVLKLLGAEHEQQAVRGGVAAAAHGREAALPAAALQGASGGAEDAAGTLKGVLLQVLGSSEVPPAVKEAAGQLVQQLTGQQLLLNTDRTAPFAQVTMFLPLRGQDGQETASVHIQSRRGRKGELDAANCRLWFDLDMKQLGQTMVDVQVVDRIVSLKLHNNEPWVLELLEGRREDIKTAVESIGYQLSSLRTEPLPELSTAAAPAKQSDYVPDSYKGVDYRI
ncbi:DNA ligase [Paenibacillus sp. LMG 31459]|uniref:DNA ligase n=1 Tax=Paenibacillus phytohabitans TaxID=2654978 RepID=A0ABX1YAZ8_9BACL|nr:DNA ligase [Paenibacillus phytohabitans]NOU77951.1 DNA ligase [Paenibacillus phytohabitans]